MEVEKFVVVYVGGTEQAPSITLGDGFNTKEEAEEFATKQRDEYKEKGYKGVISVEHMRCNLVSYFPIDEQD